MGDLFIFHISDYNIIQGELLYPGDIVTVVLYLLDKIF